jgi:hypothetical protein
VVATFLIIFIAMQQQLKQNKKIADEKKYFNKKVVKK